MDWIVCYLISTIIYNMSNPQSLAEIYPSHPEWWLDIPYDLPEPVKTDQVSEELWWDYFSEHVDVPAEYEDDYPKMVLRIYPDLNQINFLHQFANVFSKTRYACYESDIVGLLNAAVEMGLDVNKLDEHGRSALHYCAQTSGDLIVSEYCSYNDGAFIAVALFSILVGGYHLDPLLSDRDGNTPFHFHMSNNDFDREDDDYYFRLDKAAGVTNLLNQDPLYTYVENGGTDLMIIVDLIEHGGQLGRCLHLIDFDCLTYPSYPDRHEVRRMLEQMLRACQDTLEAPLTNLDMRKDLVMFSAWIQKNPVKFDQFTGSVKPSAQKICQFVQLLHKLPKPAVRQTLLYI